MGSAVRVPEAHVDTCECRGCLAAQVTAAVLDALRRQSSAEPARVLTPAAAADYLGVSIDTIYRGIRSGRLPALQVGQQYRLSARALDRLMEGDELSGGQA